MSAGSGSEDRVNSLNKTPVAELRKQVNELTQTSQNLLTEKLFLENEINQLKKRISRLDDEIRIMREPPFIVGYIQDLTENHAIVRSSNGTVFQVSVNSNIDRDLLKPGTRISMNQDTLTVIDILNDGWDPLVASREIIEKPDTLYEEIGGMQEQINQLKQSIELPLNKPETFRKMGLTPPKGVLLTGPPGTGKTMMARALANSTSATFIGLVGSELAQKYIGEGGRLVRELFDLAKQKSPTIIFIDEIDAIGSKRLDSSTSGDREVQRTLMQLLAEMDGFEATSNIKIIAATNRPELLDKALLRPGRLDRIIEIGLPDKEGRLDILQIISKGIPTDKEVNLQQVSKQTKGFSGAELKALIMEAGLNAISNNRNSISRKDINLALEIINENRLDLGKSNPEALYG
ncbi:MAG: proteasome-activating nucleotidase [Euryarchaeota archaeon]|nr:proteasome-activating nucleotidase [Euryarchaeota archaeon]|tara:strand:- start:3983 stop:5197 length:1215 start_codon:yes stop_codon:yes gene_type:complete